MLPLRTPPLKQKSMSLKVRLMLYSSGPLTASLNAVMDADASCLIMLCALPPGRGIVTLDCGYKRLPGGLNYSFLIRQKQRMSKQKYLCLTSCLFYLVSFNLILVCLWFISLISRYKLYNSLPHLKCTTRGQMSSLGSLEPVHQLTMFS